MRQWGVHQLKGGRQLVLVIQSDMLQGIDTYLVAPLIAQASAPSLDRRLLPTILAGDDPLIALILSIASVPRSEIGAFVAFAEHARDEVTRALDMVLSGI